MSKSLAEQNFRNAWNRLVPAYLIEAPYGEYRFTGEREFRFDFAWPSVLVAIELEGLGKKGVAGRHQRVAGYSEDCVKYTLAAKHGWRILRFMSKDRRHAGQWVADAVEAIVWGRALSTDQPHLSASLQGIVGAIRGNK